MYLADTGTADTGTAGTPFGAAKQAMEHITQQWAAKVPMHPMDSSEPRVRIIKRS